MKRPRFILRTMAIVVTLICAYFPTWEATKRQADSITKRPGRVVKTRTASGYEVLARVDRARAKAILPLVISQDEFVFDEAMGVVTARPKRYYLWLFGLTYILPYEATWTPPAAPKPATKGFSKTYPAEPRPAPARQPGSGFSKDL